MKNKTPEWLKPFKRKFVSKDFAITDADSIKPWVDKLLGREINSPAELVKWLEDVSELHSILGEDSNRRYVDMTCDTKDDEKKERYLYFVCEIQPKLTEWDNALNKKFYDSPFKKKLGDREYGRLDRQISTAIELYSEKNIPLEVGLSKMSQEYQTVTGAWLVEFNGKKMTMPQMGVYLFNTDRPLREGAWKAMTGRRLDDKAALESIFDEMVKTRHEFARNLGLADYREYTFRAKLRDYSPQDCLEFHDSIEKGVVPLVKKIAEKRKKRMKLKKLRPWDMNVDPLGRPPLAPFKKAVELEEGIEKIFHKIDPRLGERFNSIRSSMDLESRDGKAPGGYQTTFEEQRLPFIFTNAVGLHSDVTTLLHEGGHAFHSLACRHLPMIWYRHASMEFSEVASMTQELFGNTYLGAFYKDEESLKRAQLEQLERTADIFPWVATIDAFQHWIYTNPKHTPDERAEKWMEITKRFEVETDYSGLNPDIKRYAWHRQLHIFEVPFYYIEYAIAQLGALQFYKMYKDDPAKAVGNYLNALTLGGSRAPQELFEAAGIKMDFSLDMLSSLMAMVEEEINELENG